MSRSGILSEPEQGKTLSSSAFLSRFGCLSRKLHRMEMKTFVPGQLRKAKRQKAGWKCLTIHAIKKKAARCQPLFAALEHDATSVQCKKSEK
jgi:hypothetical protein